MAAQHQQTFEEWFQSTARSHMYHNMPSPEDLAREAWQAGIAAHTSFQGRVAPWLMECFGLQATADKEERNRRFLEEALELVQACGGTADEAHFLVDYVFGRETGEQSQEVGGVMTTLAALCLAQGLNMHECGETELARVWTKVDMIRAKQAAKPQYVARHQSAARTAQVAALEWIGQHGDSSSRLRAFEALDAVKANPDGGDTAEQQVADALGWIARNGKAAASLAAVDALAPAATRQGYGVSDAYIDRLIMEIRQLGATRDNVRDMLQVVIAKPVMAESTPTPPATTTVFGAETVLALLDTQQWRLSRSATSSFLTDEANKRDAWFVERTEPPFGDKDGMRIWFGPTPMDAFNNAHRMLGMTMPCTAPAPISPDVARRIAELESYEPTIDDIEKFKRTLSRLGIGTPEGLEELGIKWHSYIRTMMRSVLHGDPFPVSLPDGHQVVSDAFISHFCNAVDNLGDLPINDDWAAAWEKKAIQLLDEYNAKPMAS